ncbi:hypothetical protein [Sinorhizobium terangae]|uniref:Uncharacterized protein n=1 Tax=Sinorhizobium terangae TaxID=110322 RepID=A0A6N7L8Z5_SINTE|nr:hypothetical protein [Sinorhizobium terangae]MBB4186175.1 hypothetical protein [Sinorhizobium terangae]MQX14086.1 hypothetical protein [Sinorhizobium terangae]WFU47156.1 hypothetical protein QA637_14940 [Sinorhizobium terangae]
MAAAQEVLLLVGRLNYVWTNTESLLIYIIAHLLKVDKESAIIVFLTLNTTRARIDLTERLAKLPATPPETRDQVLSITERLKQQSKMRNKYNHCIYSFDEQGEISSTQLMRLVEGEKEIRYGKVEQLDAREMARLENAIREITDISKALWSFIRSRPNFDERLI